MRVAALVLVLSCSCVAPPAQQGPPPVDDSVSVPDDMVDVPAGAFAMGCDDCDVDEQPLHDVTLPRFFIDRTEVTRVAYAACVDAGACEAARGLDATVDPDHPISLVTFAGAQQYCASLGRRLPTEAEWEKAARGDDGRRFPWGDDDATCDLANTLGCTDDDGTTPVGAFPDGASPYGALDMAGNVWEWTASVYAADAYQNGEPGDGETRVYRGGSSGNDATLATTTNRADSYSPAFGGVGLGFRCAMTPG